MSNPMQKDILDQMTPKEAQTPETAPVKAGYALEVAAPAADEATGAADHPAASGEK